MRGQPRETNRKQIEITTPENIILQLPLPSTWERYCAFFIDVLLLCGVSLAMLIACTYFFFASPFIIATIITLGTFLLWNGYFIFFELRSGATPAKKWRRFRVISQDGSLLPSSAVYVRNIMREVELWLPLRLLLVISFAPDNRFIDSQALPLLWVFLLGLLPFIDKYNRRFGDILAGTIVVKSARTYLERDLVQEYQKYCVVQQDEVVEPEREFSDKMLDIYGKQELQTLEEILRQSPSMLVSERNKLFRTVTDKIAHKIGYDKPISGYDLEPFLNRFYQAQRKHLENKLLRGRSLKRRTKKWIRNRLGK